MTGLALHIQGENGATVSNAAGGPFSAGILTTGPINVNAHSTQETVNWFFKAPAGVKPVGTALVRAHIGTFDANLTHIMNDHSGHADPPAGTYSSQVFP